MKKIHPYVKGVIVVQILDGILTYIGITRFGELAEGNPLVQYLIMRLGVLFGILLPKSLAILSTIPLNKVAYTNDTIRAGLAFTIIFYSILAILPWTVILLLT